jgi:hypothetical protein
MTANTPQHPLPRPSDFLITPMDVIRGIRHVVRHLGWYDLIGLVNLVCLLLILQQLLGFSVESLFFWGFGFALFYWRRDGRIAVGLGLLCLVAVPLLLALGQPGILIYGEAWAEQMAVWAYYFLIIGVGKQLVDLGVDRFQSRKNQPAAPVVDRPEMARFRMQPDPAQAQTDATTRIWTPAQPALQAKMKPPAAPAPLSGPFRPPPVRVMRGMDIGRRNMQMKGERR